MADMNTNKPKQSRILGAPGYVRQAAQCDYMLSIATQQQATTWLAFKGPVLRCIVNRSADFDAVRIARTQFAISSFGQTIATLKIVGIQYASLMCPDAAKVTSIAQIYNNYCVAHAGNKDKRLYVTTDDGVRYQCVLVDMQRSIDSTRQGQMYATYTLTLLGVPYDVK